MKAKKPNILYVFADQLRRSALGFMKEEGVLTPCLDAFSEEALVFENAISSCPLCSPYRGCLFTGKYPLSNGIFTNCKTGLDIMLRETDSCLSDVLYEQGYHNGYIGKWHLDQPEENICSKPISGAKNWDAYTPPGTKRHHFDYWYSYGANDTHLTPHYWENTSRPININQWSVEHETDKAIDYIERHKEEPFALFVAFNPPHSPYDMVPEKYFNLYKNKEIDFRPNCQFENLHCHTFEKFDYDKKALELITKQYFAAVTGVDENFGRLIKCLKDNGLEKDTIIIFTADHGDMLGSHGLMAKHVWYEEAIGIPFVIKWGNGPLQKGRTQVVLEPTDIMPTLFGMLDIDCPKGVEGVDISSAIVQDGEILGNKAGFLCAFPGRDVFLEAFQKAQKNPKDFGWRGIRTEAYTFIIELGYYPECSQAKKYLYDIKNDPYQLNPIAYDDLKYKEIIKTLEGNLIQWLKTQKDGILNYL